MLPMGLGYVEGVTHDYVRHGTTTLFAALDVANGTVLTQCKAHHRHQEFLSFLRHIEANVPAHLDVHLICDNYGTHKHARVRAWLARHPRFHLPNADLQLVAQSSRALVRTHHATSIRRGSFDSVADLKRKIHEFVEHYNQHPRPFMWTATAESILAKIERLCKVINGTRH
jgi:transposase